MAVRFTVYPPGDASSPSVIEFDMDRILVGRGAVCDLRLPHPTVSYHHATIVLDGSRYTIMDCGSTNGTVVNGSRLAPELRRALSSEDAIEIGGFKLVPALSVPMTVRHSEERTETVARDLLRVAGPRHAPASIILQTGEGEDRAFDLAPDVGACMLIGGGDDCDIVIDDGSASPPRARLERLLSGWTIEALEGEVHVDGTSRSRCRLSDGQVVEMGVCRILFSDPEDCYYATLLREKDDISDLAPAVIHVDTPKSDPDVSSSPAGKPIAVSEDEEQPAARRASHISSRTESEVEHVPKPRSTEYSWLVVVLGILAFLGSLVLLLLLIF